MRVRKLKGRTTGLAAEVDLAWTGRCSETLKCGSIAESITLLVADKNVTQCSKLDKLVVGSRPSRKQMRSNSSLHFGTSIAFHGMHSAEVIE
jgi:hypothetical protein